MDPAGYAAVAVLNDRLEYADVSDVSGCCTVFMPLYILRIGEVKNVLIYYLIEFVILMQRQIARSILNDAVTADGLCAAFCRIGDLGI